VLGLLPRLVDSALLATLLLAAAIAPTGAAAASSLSRAAASAPAPSVPSVGVSIDPSSFWMRTGENVTLQAVWSTDSALCPISALWFLWSVEEENATGFLNVTSGPSVVFAADSLESGTVLVNVRSAATLDCETNETVVEQTNESEISIVTPLALSDVEAGPALLSAGGVATLDANLTGGAPPYIVNVVWGDGTHTTFNQTAPGAFSLNHTFASGEFVPYVLVSDSESDVENRSVEEAISVGSGFRVAVFASTYIAEVGIPVEFTGIAVDAPPDSIALYECTGAATDSPRTSSSVSNETEFGCTFQSAGTQEILFGVYPTYPGGPSASVVLYETVVAPPELGVTPVVPLGEVGRDALIEVTLSGGALPISLAWNLTGNRSAGTEVVDSDGSGMLVLPLAAAGDYALGIRATDGFGVIGTNSSVTMQIDSALDADVLGGRSLGPVGVLTQITGEVFSGCPPFAWWVIPQFLVDNQSVSNGSIDTVGAFSWNGLYTREGTVGIAVVVVDSCGASWETNLVEDLVPPLSAEISAEPGPTSVNQTVAVTVFIQGGWPPYHCFLNGSDNESWNRTIPSAGTNRFELDTDANGNLTLAVTLIDDLGRSVDSVVTVALPGADPTPTLPQPPETGGAPSGSETPSASSVGALLASFTIPTVLGTALVILWRRHARKGKEKPTAPDPVAVLKQIIEPADGAERFTVELLAEEAGIPLPVVRSTIDQLVAQGTVRSESGADGEEVLSWSAGRGQ
jgi:hypothetical protein